MEERNGGVRTARTMAPICATEESPSSRSNLGRSCGQIVTTGSTTPARPRVPERNTDALVGLERVPTRLFPYRART